ncbi:MAG TPA: hypothetical protein VFE62_21135 [Gemmataceae bacterium]|nr:hypothetical protein [Gemmataceae bacterium]
MSTTTLEPEVLRSTRPHGLAFGLCALGFIVGVAAVSGWLPIQFSIVSVFLCAGPHNWVEARYFLSRLPARWGRLQAYFLFGFAGVFALTAAFALLPHVLEAIDASLEEYLSSYATWNTLLVLWIAMLVFLRSRQNPRREWGWIWPVAFIIIALAWVQPMLWDLSLVYLHPLIALWILDREFRRSRPEYRRVYHVCLLAIPVCLGLIWWNLAGAADLLGDDALSMRITRHSGADYTGYLAGVSTHCLVATHTFLEAVHYGVWLIAIPWLGMQTSLWNVAAMPLGRRSATWTRVLQGFLLLSAGIVVVLWLCFWADYPITRDVYFTLAMVHVLAEVPFLLRAL